MLDLFDQLHHDQGMTFAMVTHGQKVPGRTERTIHMHDGRVMEGGK